MECGYLFQVSKLFGSHLVCSYCKRQIRCATKHTYWHGNSHRNSQAATVPLHHLDKHQLRVPGVPGPRDTPPSLSQVAGHFCPTPKQQRSAMPSHAWGHALHSSATAIFLHTPSLAETRTLSSNTKQTSTHDAPMHVTVLKCSNRQETRCSHCAPPHQGKNLRPPQSQDTTTPPTPHRRRNEPHGSRTPPATVAPESHPPRLFGARDSRSACMMTTAPTPPSDPSPTLLENFRKKSIHPHMRQSICKKTRVATVQVPHAPPFQPAPSCRQLSPRQDRSGFCRDPGTGSQQAAECFAWHISPASR